MIRLALLLVLLAGCAAPPTYRIQVFQSGKKVAEFVHEGYLSRSTWGMDLQVIEEGEWMIQAAVVASDGVIVAERIYPEE